MRPSISSRRSSQYSVKSPLTPRPKSAHGRNASGDWGLVNGFGNSVEAESSNGLGNLADELAEAFEEEEEEPGEEVSELQYDGAGSKANGYPAFQSARIPISPPPPQPTRELSLSPPKHTSRSKHRQKASQYDGSDYGSESDLEGADAISPSLEARMAAIESLARRGTEVNGSDTDDVVKRISNCLKDLGSQAGVENGASRLITAHTALTSHLTNHTRTLQTLCHTFLSPLSAPPDPDFIDDLLPLLTSLITELPTPTPKPLSSLHSLHASTNELTSILTYLSDTLHMSRQTTSLAARRLRAAREMVIEMRKEAEARDEGERWVEKGQWEKRLAERDCARICGDVVGGFEEVCNGWRERLVGGLGVEVGAA